MDTVLSKVDNSELSLDYVQKRISGTGISDYKKVLIKGDVCETSKKFSSENPGFRISLLYIDVDLEEPTYHSLKNLWNQTQKKIMQL